MVVTVVVVGGPGGLGAGGGGLGAGLGAGPSLLPQPAKMDELTANAMPLATSRDDMMETVSYG